jgi:hypothetical protein
MSAYQLLEPGRVFFTLTGLEIAAGGSVTFYAPGTTDLQDTWSNPGLTVLNPNPVDLDSSGRLETPAWGDEAYDVVLKDADGATVWTEEVRPQVQPGATIPALEEDEFLTNNGIDLLWQPVRPVPDPDVSEGYLLQVTGGIPTWVAPAVAEDFDIVVSGLSMTIDGTGGKLRHLAVKGVTGTNSGGRTQTVNVTFPTAFSGTPAVFCQLANSGNLSSAGNQPSPKVSSVSTTGFTVLWTMGELDDDRSIFDFNAAVSFDYLAIGPAA